MRKSFVSLLSLVLLLGVILSVGCGGGGGGTSPVAATSDGSLADLTGRVTYNGNAVPKAAVYLMKATGEETELSRRASVMAQAEPDFSILTADGNGYQTTSDANGYYSFTQVPVGTYTVQALISPSIQVSQPVVLGAISNLDLALKPTGSISGTLTLDGSPIQAMVFLQGTSYIGITDLSGSFKILNVPVETTPYTLIPVVPSTSYPASVRASLSGAGSANKAPASQQPLASPVQGSILASPYGSVYTFKDSPIQVTPVAGTNTDLGTLELMIAMGTLTGIAQIEGATMHSGIYVSTSGSSAYTDSEGKYTLENVYFGLRTVSFSKYYGSENYTASKDVLVDSVATKTVDTVTLQPESATTAQVDVSLAGLTGAGGYVYYYVYNQDNPDSYLYYGYNSNPATSSYNLDPGTYYVRITPGSDYTLLNPAAGSTDLLASITVAAGGNASFVARLQYNKADLSGTVSGIDANYPVSYAYLNPGGYSAYISGGSFSFTGITPGAYTLSISSPGYTTYSSAITLAAGANSRSATLTPIFPTVSGVTPGSTITITGTRFDVSTASVYIAPQGGSYSSYTAATRTATQMTYNVSSFAPGAYTVKARGADGAISTNSGTFSNTFSAGPSLTSSAAQIGTSTYNVVWNTLTGATGYVVSQTGGPSYTVGVVNSQLFTGLQPNSNYTFTIYALGNGISNSPVSSISITTKTVFATPVAYDSGISLTSLKQSCMNNGFLYVLDEVSFEYTYKLIRFDLRNPTSAGATTTYTISTSLTTPSCIFANDSYVYVGWRSGTQISLTQYSASTLAPTGNTFTSNFSASAGGIKLVADPNSASQLIACTWGSSGTNVASVTWLNSTTLAAGSPAQQPMNLTGTITGFEWVKFTGSDSTPYIVMLYNTSEAPNQGTFVVYDATLTTKFESGSTSGSAFDLTAAPTTGYVWSDYGIHYRNPPAPYGTNITYQGQAVTDGSGRYYIYQNSSGSMNSIIRYNAAEGRVTGSPEFFGGYTASFGNRMVHYDAANTQVVVLKPKDPTNSNLMALTFSTRD